MSCSMSVARILERPRGSPAQVSVGQPLRRYTETGDRPGPALTAAGCRDRASLLLRARPGVAPVRRWDRHVVDGGLPPAHQALVVELPQLVAVAAEPLARRVVPLVLEPDGDPVAAEPPEALAQDVVELALPLGGQERDDLLAAGEEGVAVPPDRVGGVGEADAVGVASVPGVLGGLHLAQGRVLVERRERGACFAHVGLLGWSLVAASRGAPFAGHPWTGFFRISRRPGRPSRWRCRERSRRW